MRLLFSNKFFFFTSCSSFFNQFGSAIYNLVFVIYVANVYQSPLLVGLANVTMVVPYIFQIWIAKKADEVRQRRKQLLWMPVLQVICFLAVALFSLQTSLVSFVAICLLNILSDCMSQYTSGMFLPVMKHAFKEEELMEVYSFRSVVSYVSQFAGQSFGLALLTLTNNAYWLIAVINALSFLFGFLLWLPVQVFFDLEVSFDVNIPLRKQLKEMYNASKKALSVEKDKVFLQIMGLIVLSNVIGSGLVTVFTISFLEHTLYGLDYGQSVFVLEMTMLFGAILAGLFSHDYFAQRSFKDLIVLQLVLQLVIVVLSLVGLDFLWILPVFALDCYVVGKFNPKFQATLTARVPSELLAQVSSFLSFIVTISIPVGTALFGLLTVLNRRTLWIILLLVLSLALVRIRSIALTSNEI